MKKKEDYGYVIITEAALVKYRDEAFSVCIYTRRSQK
jgi:hypothetical protein